MNGIPHSKNTWFGMLGWVLGSFNGIWDGRIINYSTFRDSLFKLLFILVYLFFVNEWFLTRLCLLYTASGDESVSNINSVHLLLLGIFHCYSLCSFTRSSITLNTSLLLVCCSWSFPSIEIPSPLLLINLSLWQTPFITFNED